MMHYNYSETRKMSLQYSEFNAFLYTEIPGKKRVEIFKPDTTV